MEVHYKYKLKNSKIYKRLSPPNYSLGTYKNYCLTCLQMKANIKVN